MSKQLATISEALYSLKQGRIVILIDDEDRENEGDLIIPAALTTSEHINFMATHGRGLVCLAMSEEDIDRLELPLMTRDNDCKLGTAFTVSIDARDGITTGISAHDRAHTVRLAANPKSNRKHFRAPGHIFPLRARKGGVLERSGHTEAAVELARLSGHSGAAVICEIMKDDGTMARLPDLLEFSEKHKMDIISIRDVIDYISTQKEAA